MISRESDFQSVNPCLQIACGIAESRLRNARHSREHRSTHLRNEFFFAVGFRAELVIGGVFLETIQTGFVSGRVCEFVEKRAVIRFWRFEATSRRHPHDIRRWPVKRLRMLLESRRIWHLIGDGFALCDRIDWFAVVAMERFQPLALLDVENAIIAKQNGSLVLRLSVLVLACVFAELPKRN